MHFTPQTRSGYTLIELTVVILLLGLLGAMAVGRFFGASEEAMVSATRVELDVLATQIEIQTANNGGRLPTTIEPNWFRSNKLPSHPANTFGVPEIQIVRGGTDTHPVNKTLHAGSPGAYWYNTDSGVVRARVPQQESNAATLELYNLINGSALTDPSDRDPADVGGVAP